MVVFSFFTLFVYIDKFSSYIQCEGNILFQIKGPEYERLNYKMKFDDGTLFLFFETTAVINLATFTFLNEIEEVLFLFISQK